MKLDKLSIYKAEPCIECGSLTPVFFIGFPFCSYYCSMAEHLPRW